MAGSHFDNGVQNLQSRATLMLKLAFLVAGLTLPTHDETEQSSRLLEPQVGQITPFGSDELPDNSSSYLDPSK